MLAAADALELNRAFTSMKSVYDCDGMNVRNLIDGILAKTPREKLLTLSYHRVVLNIETLIVLTDARHFQAILMLARAILEATVELKLVPRDADSANKVQAFMDLEKLRSARKNIAVDDKFSDTAPDEEVMRTFVQKREAQIQETAKELWPDEKISDIQHWTLLKLPERCASLGRDFETLYHVHYAELSWYAHGSTTGVANMDGNALSMGCGVGYHVATSCFTHILETMIDEFKLLVIDDKLKKKIKFAAMMHYTDNQTEREALAREIGLYA
jgi:hypothetical protein